MKFRAAGLAVVVSLCALSAVGGASSEFSSARRASFTIDTAPSFGELEAPTATATPTAVPCGDDSDASLAFVPEQIGLKGAGPFTATMRVKNSGKSTAALDVVLGLQTGDGAGYLQRVDFGSGQAWLIGGLAGATLYNAGTIAPGATSAIPITIGMTPAWQAARGDTAAKIRVKVTSARCVKESSESRLTIDLSR